MLPAETSTRDTSYHMEWCLKCLSIEFPCYLCELIYTLLCSSVSTLMFLCQWCWCLLWNGRSYSAYNPPTVTGTGAFAKDFIVNLIFRALAVVEIFRRLPTCDRKLSNCFPWCSYLLTETVPSVRGADFWTKYAFKLAIAFRWSFSSPVFGSVIREVILDISSLQMGQ